MKLFITGDRSGHPAVAASILGQRMLKAAIAGENLNDYNFVTGDNSGVEYGVRAFAEQYGLNVEVVPTPLDIDERPDWVVRNEQAQATSPDKTIFIHSQPDASRLYAVTAEGLSDDQFELVSPMAELAGL